MAADCGCWERHLVITAPDGLLHVLCSIMRALHFHQAQSSGICLPVIAEHHLACKPVGLPLQPMGPSATRPRPLPRPLLHQYLPHFSRLAG